MKDCKNCDIEEFCNRFKKYDKFKCKYDIIEELLANKMIEDLFEDDPEYDSLTEEEIELAEKELQELEESEED